MAESDGSMTAYKDKALSRRQMMARGGIWAAALSIICRNARADGKPRVEGSGADRKLRFEESRAADATASIHQEVDLKASPQRVYEVLLGSKQFSAFTGLRAEISREAGGAFSCFENQIAGRNVELVAGRRIVQAWRSNGWPEGSYSIVRFELNPQGSGTRLVMDHRGFPDGAREHLDAGWKSHYWEPLAKYLA